MARTVPLFAEDFAVLRFVNGGSLFDIAPALRPMKYHEVLRGLLRLERAGLVRRVLEELRWVYYPTELALHQIPESSVGKA